jgi:hypothetical protein
MSGTGNGRARARPFRPDDGRLDGVRLAERVEHEQPQRIRVALSPSSSPTVYPDTMPLLGYFISVGVALFLGLVALNAYVDPGRPDGAPSLSMAPATASLLPARPPASVQSHSR